MKNKIKNSNLDFFPNIESFDFNQISDFLTDSSRKQINKFQKQDLDKIVSRVNSLILQNNNISVKIIGNLLSSFGNFGYKKEELVDLNILKISEIINNSINDNIPPQDIINVVDGFSKLGYQKNDSLINETNLSKLINKKFSKFSPIASVVALRSLSNMGYSESDNEQLSNSTEKFISKIKESKDSLPEKELASFIHSLAKMKKFDHLFNNNSSLGSIFDSDKIDKLSSESAFSLLQSHMICSTFGNKNLFSKEQIKLIADKYKPQETNISNLHYLVSRSLPKQHVTNEESLYNLGKKSIRNCDIFYSIGNKRIFIEVDGDSHFDTNGNSNYSTRLRDEVNRALISKKANQEPASEFYYLTLPYYELSQNNSLTTFLDNKISSLQPIHGSNNNYADSKISSTIKYENIEEKPSKYENIEEKPSINVSNLETDSKNNFDLKESSAADSSNSNKKKKKKKNKKLDTPTDTYRDEKPESSKETIVLKIDHRMEEIKDAILSNDSYKVLSLIESGMEINGLCSGEQKPIDFAIAQETPSLEIINNLVIAGANISHIDESKASLLLTSSLENDKIELACALISNTQLSHTNLLNVALEKKSLLLVKTLINSENFDKDSDEAKNVLRNSILTRNLEIFNELVSAGVKTECSEINDKNTLFASAVEEGMVKSVQYLIDDGIDINQTIRYSRQHTSYKEIKALVVAIEKGYCDIVNCLVNGGVDLSQELSYSNSLVKIPPLIIAIATKAPETIFNPIFSKINETQNSDLANSTYDGLPLLIHSLACGADDISISLLEKGANSSIKSTVGLNSMSPIQMAIERNASAEVISKLTEKGANINDVNSEIVNKDDEYSTTIYEAIRNKSNASIEALIDLHKKHRNIRTSNQGEYNALACAVLCQSPQNIVRDLINIVGFSPNINLSKHPTEQPNNLLFIALDPNDCNNKPAVLTLIENGADLNVRDKSGKSLFQRNDFDLDIFRAIMNRDQLGIDKSFHKEAKEKIDTLDGCLDNEKRTFISKLTGKQIKKTKEEKEKEEKELDNLIDSITAPSTETSPKSSKQLKTKKQKQK
jgi:hypothetical protein